MTPYQRNFIEDPNTKVAAYESLLDLFTLISFIMIFAAFIYVRQASAGGANAASVSAQEAGHAGGPPQGVPKDVLLLILSREDSKDRLTVVDGATGSTTPVLLTVDTAENVLNGLSPAFAKARRIDIAVYEEKQPVNPGLVLSIQRWLSARGYGKYNFYFVGPK